MASSTLNSDIYVNGNLSARTFTPPASSITDTAIVGAAKIQASKLGHRNTFTTQLFGPTTTITALTQWLNLLRGGVGTLVSVAAAIAVQATGADRTVNVDLQKSTGGGAFATVLSATILINNVTVIRTAVTGSFSSTSLVAGDILETIVTVAGAAGAQAQGLILTVVVDEDAS
jgi:hypothetical protein